MATKPIIFSTPMVRAILDWRKTMTRRVLKPQPVIDSDGMWHWRDCQWMDGGLGFPASGIADHAPYQPGDLLWVRETWTPFGGTYLYRANGGGAGGGSWRPSIYMPREAARLFLRVKDVRVERLQEITEADAIAEGVPDALEGNVGDEVYCPTCKGNGLVGAAHPITLVYYGTECTDCDTAVKRFRHLWDGINAKRAGGAYAWDLDPWVWVVVFDRITKEAAQ